eukprot:gene11873-biopygen4753
MKPEGDIIGFKTTSGADGDEVRLATAIEVASLWQNYSHLAQNVSGGQAHCRRIAHRPLLRSVRDQLEQ